MNRTMLSWSSGMDYQGIMGEFVERELDRGNHDR